MLMEGFLLHDEESVGQKCPFNRIFDTQLCAECGDYCFVSVSSRPISISISISEPTFQAAA